MIVVGGGWAGITASARGAAHVRTSKPNQDAVLVVEIGEPTPGLAAALADGHGGDRYIRSDVGARLGVEVACELGRELAALLGPSPTREQVEGWFSTTAASLVERWRANVSAHLEAEPFSEEERSAVSYDLDGDIHLAYGCTLLLAVATSTWTGLLQIGDGDVTVVRGDEVTAPVPGDSRLVGGRTTSLCLPGAERDARISAHIDGPLDLVVLTSDGYANSFVSEEWQTEVGRDLRVGLHDDGTERVEELLPGWLAESAEASGDDVTMALLHRIVP